MAETAGPPMLRRVPATYAIEIDEMLVVLDRATGEMHQLDPAATAIWRAVDGHRSVRRIVDRVAARLGAEPAAVAAEVHAGLRQLLVSGLLRGDVGLLPTDDLRTAEPDTPSASAPPRPISARAAIAARSLQLDLAAVEIDAALRSEGVEPLLLKGPMLARWLYGGYGERQYGDVDLLVAPGAVNLAEDLLRSHGLARRSVPLAQTVPPHATAWYRDSDRVEIDLHDRLWGCSADPAVQWKVLGAHRETLDLVGIPVDVPDVPVRLLHLCLHAAQGPAGGRKKLDDLHRALATVTTGDWFEARRLAVDLGAEGAMGAGLRLFEAGEALADRLVLPSPRLTEVILMSSGTADGATLGILHALRAPSPIAAVRFAWGRLFPSPDYMRQWASFPTDSSTGLARAYLARSWSFLSRAIRAVQTLIRAWWSTRRPGG